MRYTQAKIDVWITQSQNVQTYTDITEIFSFRYGCTFKLFVWVTKTGAVIVVLQSD